MRAISESQEAVLQRLDQNIAKKVLDFFKMWQKPLKARMVISGLARTLASNGLTTEDLKAYAEEHSKVRFYYGEQTGIELIFPAAKDMELSDDEILEYIFEMDTEREELRQRRLNERRKQRYMGEIK